MKAERLFKDVMQRQLQNGVPQNDNSIIEMSLKLAALYAEWGQDDKAEKGYKFCIEEQEKKIKKLGPIVKSGLYESFFC